MSWNPEAYLTFATERTRPAAELLARVKIDAPERAIDLGCGPGNSTALLAARWPKAALEGLDSSEAMLAEAKATHVPAIWVKGDIGSWTAKSPYDVIYANAAFQWVPHQDQLLPRLMSDLKPSGVLAFQVPMNFDAPSHRLMREVAQDPRFREKLASVREVEKGDGERYYDILEPHAASLDIWQTEYLQVLKGEDAVYRWVSGTGLRPFVDALEGEERKAFIADYKKRLNAAYPTRPNGVTLFPFQRLFVVAVR